MTGNDVCTRALTYKNYVYWYGGKGQKCTQALLDTLAKLYPAIYTSTYKAKCRKDIQAGKMCIDCSGLVCKALGISDIGTWQMSRDSRFIPYEGPIKNGMIVWKSTHVGIYQNGHVIEARGIDYDVTTNRKYNRKDWATVYTFKNIVYNNNKDSMSAYQYLQAAIDAINGKYGNGTDRVKKLTTEGFDPDKVQKLINIASSN